MQDDDLRNPLTDIRCFGVEKAATQSDLAGAPVEIGGSTQTGGNP